MVRALEKDGWVATKQKGSHLKFRKDGRAEKVTVPMHNRDLRIGTLRSILAAAQLDDDRFLELLHG